MITSQEDFSKAKSRDLIVCECVECKSQFTEQKHYVQSYLKNGRGKFCSKECSVKSMKRKSPPMRYKCSNCEIQIFVWQGTINKAKRDGYSGERFFCGSSCAAKYNNTHKTTGNRRSKLEGWLEIKLKELYPNLEIHFNRKDTINSELDIFIPSLSFAVELNGIFHVEPIYGEEKLKQIKNNDDRKFQACIEKKIELCIIDTSKQKYFKESTCEPYLDIIINLINKKLAGVAEVESAFSIPSTAKNLEDSPDYTPVSC